MVKKKHGIKFPWLGKCLNTHAHSIPRTENKERGNRILQERVLYTIIHTLQYTDIYTCTGKTLFTSYAIVVYANEASRISHSAGDPHKLGTRLELSDPRYVQYGLSGRAPISHTSQLWKD